MNKIKTKTYNFIKKQISLYIMALKIKKRLNVLKENIKYFFYTKKEWNKLSKSGNLEIEFIEKYKRKLNLNLLFFNQKLPKDFIYINIREIDFSNERYCPIAYNKIDNELISRVKISSINYDSYCYQFFDISYGKYAYYLEGKISLTNALKVICFPIDELKRNISIANSELIYSNTKLEEKDLLELMSIRPNWNSITETQVLSEKFILEHYDTIKSNNVSYIIFRNQHLSDTFYITNINLFSEDDLYYIIKYNKFSIDNLYLVIEFFNTKEFNTKSLLHVIIKYQKVDQAFIDKFNLEKEENNWLYETGDYKLNVIKNTNRYETDDNYVYAYKGIRHDYYSHFNFHYKYEIGGTYESHCNYNYRNENSFGLSAGTKNFAYSYCDRKVVKVKIHKDDIGALVHNNKKIRCCKFTVIEEL